MYKLTFPGACFIWMSPREVFYIKSFIFLIIIVSLLISGMDIVKVGEYEIGVVSLELPLRTQKTQRNFLTVCMLNTFTLGGGIEFCDSHTTIVSGYCPFFKKADGLHTNVQAAARSTGGVTSIIIAVPALPPESY